MTGLSRITGRGLSSSSAEHLVQSIGDILTTPLGSRVARRDYGSQLPDLIDRPHNAETRLKIYAATAIALMRWEPRVRLARVQLDGEGASAILRLDVVRTDLPRRSAQTLTIPLAA